MYNNSTMNIKENQLKELGKLIDISSGEKERPWREKKIRTLELAESYKRLGMKKAYRVLECSSYLEFKRYIETKELKLHQANFCKVRL